MSARQILLYPHPILRTEGAPVTAFNQNLIALLEDMFETMITANGIGLAAPQIGESIQVAVIDTEIDSLIPLKVLSGEVAPLHSGRIELINPKITHTDQIVSSEEGCLSIPEFRDSIKRFERIHVAAQNRLGEPFEIYAEGLLAYCLQHEIDHLNGILFTDKLSRIKRHLFLRWYERQPWKTD